MHADIVPARRKRLYLVAHFYTLGRIVVKENEGRENEGRMLNSKVQSYADYVNKDILTAEHTNV